MVIFSVLVHQCVYQILKSQLLHIPSVFEKRPEKVQQTSQSDTCSVTSMGRPQDVNLNIFHKIGFQGNFSKFPDAKCISDIAEPKYVKNLIRPILVLLWSGTSRVKQDHKGTSSGRCVPAGCQQDTCGCIYFKNLNPHIQKQTSRKGSSKQKISIKFKIPESLHQNVSDCR